MSSSSEETFRANPVIGGYFMLQQTLPTASGTQQDTISVIPTVRHVVTVLWALAALGSLILGSTFLTRVEPFSGLSPLNLPIAIGITIVLMGVLASLLTGKLVYIAGSVVYFATLLAFLAAGFQFADYSGADAFGWIYTGLSAATALTLGLVKLEQRCRPAMVS